MKVGFVACVGAGLPMKSDIIEKIQAILDVLGPSHTEAVAVVEQPLHGGDARAQFIDLAEITGYRVIAGTGASLGSTGRAVSTSRIISNVVSVMIIAYDTKYVSTDEVNGVVSEVEHCPTVMVSPSRVGWTGDLLELGYDLSGVCDESVRLERV